MGPVLILLYGIVAYLIAMASIAYAIGFVGNYWVPKSIDSGSVGPLGEALVVNILLLGLFAIQHSGMARRGFKKASTAKEMWALKTNAMKASDRLARFLSGVFDQLKQP